MRHRVHCAPHGTTLPADYVAEHVELGYATTVHAAQGFTADIMHGILTGDEDRQLLYTMLTRGRGSNHLYLQVVGDGDPHALIRPDTVTPRTPTEILQRILVREDTPTSATTVLRELSDPAARLHDAVQRYTDGLHIAAEELLGPQTVAELDRVDQYIPGLSSEPSWPTLRAHLLTLAAETGQHPLRHLQTAATGQELHTAGDMAAVLDWRLPDPTFTAPGPLPWLPGISPALQDHHVWGEYLAKRSQLVANLADQVRHSASQEGVQPVWAPPGSHPSPALIGEIAVWRAAVGVDPQDRRPTGEGQLPMASALWQRQLERSVAVCDDEPYRLGIRDSRPARGDRRHEHQHVLQPHATRPSSQPGIGW